MAMQKESLEVPEQAIVVPGTKDMLATHRDIVLLRQDMRIGHAELRSEIVRQGAELRTEMARHSEGLHRVVSSGTRQMYFALLGQMAVMLGLVCLLVALLR